jgi:hypothetical protein
MNRLKKFRNNSLVENLPSAIAIIVGVTLSILGLEILLQILPVKSTHKFAVNDISQPVLRATATSLVEPIDWKFSHAQHRKINNYGFVDNFDYIPKSQPIAVIGDSYIQSTMLPYQETLQSHLSVKFNKQIPVYSYGIPMYALAGYLGTAEYASREFQPKIFVFLLTKGDLSESIQSQSGSYFLDRPDGELKFENQERRNGAILYKSALLRYLNIQIHFNPQKIVQSQFKLSPPSEVQLDRNSYQEISERLLNLFATKTMVNSQNTIFIIDSDRNQIYDKKLKADRQELLTFKDVATAKGYRVVDTQALFETYYQDTHKRLDFLPTDFHWNAKAHQLVAERIEPIVAEMLSHKH